jgi:hypothetical protein
MFEFQFLEFKCFIVEYVQSGNKIIFTHTYTRNDSGVGEIINKYLNGGGIS